MIFLIILRNSGEAYNRNGESAEIVHDIVLSSPVEAPELDVNTEPQFDATFPYRDGLARVCKDKKWGFIGTDGEVVIPLQYNEVGDFYEGLAYARINDKWGYIDKNNEVVITFQYDVAKQFLLDSAEVQNEGETYYIDKEGNIILLAEYDWMRLDRSYDSSFLAKKNKESFYFDENGIMLENAIKYEDLPNWCVKVFKEDLALFGTPIRSAHLSLRKVIKWAKPRMI